MFGDGNALFGTHGLSFVMGADNSPATGDAYKGVYSALNWTGVPLWAKFFFQLVFAGTAATIVSGAVAERIKFGAFYLFSLLSVLFFDRVKIDDPVGATSVHLVCGIFGTLAVGLFAQDHFSPNTTGNGLLFGGGLKLLIAQLIGVIAVGIFVLTASGIVWGIIKAVMGIRVTAEEEMEGLDLGEHGIAAYPDFHSSAAYGSLTASTPASHARPLGVPAVGRSV